MRSDPVMEFIIQAKDFFIGQSNLFMGIAVGVLIVLGGVMIYSSVKKSSVHKAQEAFGRALIAYEASSVNNASANENLEKAVETFKTVVDNNKNSPQAIYS